MRREGLDIVPCELEDANAFVKQHHRHHLEVVGHKFSQAAVNPHGEIVGVAITGRPNNKTLDDGWTLEVTRNCTDGTKNAASILYGASRRATFALGYRKLITYTGKTEPGTSLLAAGFKVVGEVKGRSWNCKSRPRVDKHEPQDRLRWEVSA